MEVAIRRATAQDYDGLCELIAQVDALHRENLPGIFQEPHGPVRDRGYILDLIGDERVGLFVAETDGQLVGFVHVVMTESRPIPIFVPRRYAVIDSIAVKAELRRHGVGRALMDQAHDWARASGATAIELNVFEFNAGAVAFYRELGYATESRRMTRPLR